MIGVGGALGIALGCHCRDGSMWWDDFVGQPLASAWRQNFERNRKPLGRHQRGRPHFRLGSIPYAPGNHVSRALWSVYRIGSMVTGPEGRRRAAVRAASVSVGNDSASFSGPQATEGNLRVSQTECPPGYVTRITNMGKSPLACNSTAAPVHDLETIAWRRPSGIVHLDGSPGPNAAEAKQF